LPSFVVFRPRPPANAKGARRSIHTTRPLIENSTLVTPPVTFARHGTTPRSVPGGSCGVTLSFSKPA
jgi:hypothetical protein